VKVVVDTNVFISGVFFGGTPGRILSAWAAGRFTLVLSPAMLDEYAEVGRRLGAQHPQRSEAYRAVLEVVLSHAELTEARELSEVVCDDPDDDIFLAAAYAAGATIIVTGDRALRRVSGWSGIDILSPRQFADRHLPRP